MSHGTPNFDRRQKALQAVRRHVRRLEIETHRVKAHLARLEADYEEDIADWMSRKLRRRSPAPGEYRIDPAHADRPGESNGEAIEGELEPFVAASRTDSERQSSARQARRPHDGQRAATRDSRVRAEKASPWPTIAIQLDGPRPSAQLARRHKKYKKTAPPLLASFALHVVGLLLCVTFGFATIVQQNVPLLASPPTIDDEAASELSEVEIVPTKFDDAELQNVVSQNEEFNIADNLQRELETAQLGAGSQPLGDLGQLDALPSELGTLMAGPGSPGSGPPGGELGDAVFFGARSKGDRFVFVVDNSSSMKSGRLEAAIAELIRCVDALSPRQGFYVIFVSDQIYPMFFPNVQTDLLPATAPNKKALAEWLPRAATASGKNRELIKAMDMAAQLRPHAVFFLWDGRMDHAGVRQDVMAHMTRPNQWNFPIHTLGMGVDSLDSEYNLAAIARASGGTFRRVDVPAVRGR